MKENKPETILRHIFEGICLIVFAYLFVLSLFSVVLSSRDAENDIAYLVTESPAKSVLLLLGYSFFGFVVLSFVYLLLKKINLNAVGIVVSVISIGIAVSTALCIKIYPWADYAICCNLADQFNSGNFSDYFQPGSYISMVPYQLGLISVERILLAVFGTKYEVLQYVMIPMVGLFTYSGFKICAKLSDNNIAACFLYFWLVLTFIPLYLYITVPYGDLPSTALLMFACYITLEFLDNPKWWKGILIFASCFIALLVRTNSLIFFIGFGIVLILLFRNNKKKCIQLFLIFFSAFIISKASVSLTYNRYRTKNTQIPYIAWVVMGMNYDTYGWWNNYVFALMERSNNDTTEAAKIAKAELRDEMSDYQKNPGKLAELFYQKSQVQWNAPMLQSMNLTKLEIDEKNPYHSLYFGSLRPVAEKFMNVTLSFIYGWFCVYLVWGFFDKKRKISDYLFTIGILGGFIFTMMWESKTRYAFPYVLMLLPQVAVGFGTVLIKAVNKLPLGKKEKTCAD